MVSFTVHVLWNLILLVLMCFSVVNIIWVNSHGLFELVAAITDAEAIVPVGFSYASLAKSLYLSRWR